MSVENPLWGRATHPRRNCSSLGFEIAAVERRQVHGQTTGATQPGMANLLAQPTRPDIAAHGSVRGFQRSVFDLLLCPSSSSGLGRRDLVWINVTANPTAEWVARQITEGLSLGMEGSALPHPRSGSDLWERCHTPTFAPWASGTSLPHQPRLGRMAFAETADRIDPARSASII